MLVDHSSVSSGRVNIMGRICQKCSKELANRHSLSRHKKMYCKERNSPDSVDQQDVLPSTASIIEKPTSKESSRQETSSAPSLRIWADPVKSTNPKIQVYP